MKVYRAKFPYSYWGVRCETEQYVVADTIVEATRKAATAIMPEGWGKPFLVEYIGEVLA